MGVDDPTESRRQLGIYELLVQNSFSGLLLWVMGEHVVRNNPQLCSGGETQPTSTAKAGNIEVCLVSSFYSIKLLMDVWGCFQCQQAVAISVPICRCLLGWIAWAPTSPLRKEWKVSRWTSRSTLMTMAMGPTSWCTALSARSRYSVIRYKTALPPAWLRETLNSRRWKREVVRGQTVQQAVYWSTDGSACLVEQDKAARMCLHHQDLCRTEP